MKVFKFGGASLKSASAIQNAVRIIKSHAGEKLLVVVSAIGKTTNALEEILTLYRENGPWPAAFNQLKKYHLDIAVELFAQSNHLQQKLDQVFQSIETEIERLDEYDLVYDQVISQGEIISSLIVAEALNQSQVFCQWIDAREYILTDNTHREGKVDWMATEEKIKNLHLILEKNVILTQGFIGRSNNGLTTTLGREGSDFSAAIFGTCLDAESVTIWKDVPGVMNADPKRLPAAVVFSELPFREAAEMTYYGASVIHPKTIKPLANRDIPLLVKNFDDPSLPGTRIHECKVDAIPPLIVFKDNQCLVSCHVTDYTFINEEHLRIIFHALSELDIKINMMQNSAVSFSFCIDFRESKISKLIGQLQHHFEVYYNTGLTLITVKNYDEAAFETYRKKKGVLLEQSSRSTLQVLIKPDRAG
ncbi:MAG: aspartate kinase [Flammeovirgaceae bacterium]|nr:aspartate kinase [Flammeovirgaceae bacterium]